MGLPELILEHSRGERVQKYLRVRASGQNVFVIGSSKEADLRINGTDISGCHAVLRFRAPHWYVCDVSGTESVKVDGDVVSEKRIDGSSRLEIGGHRIQLFTRERSENLFSEQPLTGELSLQQVVIRSRGRIIDTRVLSTSEPYIYFDGEKKSSLAAPTGGQWVKSEFGATIIQQRLVSAQEILNAESLQIDRDLRKPALVAALLLLFLVATISVLGHFEAKHPDLALDQKSMDIIFNAKAIKKKIAENKKIFVKGSKAREGGSSADAPVKTVNNKQPEESTSPQANPKATAALTSLRKADLGSLIGKIAKRANKQSAMIAASGVTPDKESGRAIYSTGTSTVGGGGEASKQGASYKLGGIATRGKAGGMNNVKDGTALSGGKVGAGNVIAMTDDEETVIEGGLDKDAIAEVIKRNLGQIRYCYERQLSSNRDLYGKVLVKWTIGASGDVADPRVDMTSLKSAMVEGCILRRLAGWKFPIPKGGTQVRVSYPFLFKALD